MSELNPKQELFVQEYLKDRNATQSAIRAGYSERSAEVTGFRLLRNAKISAKVTQHVEAAAKESQIDNAKVISELAKGGMAELDIREMKWADKIKCLEALAKIMGMYDGQGAGGKGTEAAKGRISQALKNLGLGGGGS